MIVSLSILVGVLTAWLWYRVLFYDSSDFWEGWGKFAAALVRGGRRAIWRGPLPSPPPAEHFEDESWSSGIRFLLFVAASVGCGYIAYHELHKHFG